MRLGQLRRRCEARLRDLGIPEPYDPGTFVDQLAERRGRPIRLLPLPAGLGHEAPCGIWLATEHEDWVFVERATSPLHRDHILFHELAHMLFGHGDDRSQIDPVPGVLGNLDGDMVRRVLGRTSYTTEEEQEAEMLASLILARVRRSHSPAPPPSPDIAAVLDRAARTLGNGRG
jgi:hypothetical protein